MTSDEFVTLMSKALAKAWDKYEKAFEQSPHGTTAQLAALCELMGPKEVLAQIEASFQQKTTGGK